MDIQVVLSESDVRRLIKDEVERLTGQSVAVAEIKIEVKSKHNFRSEWETANFRAEYRRFTLDI